MIKKEIHLPDTKTILWMIIILALIVRLLYLFIVVGADSYPGNIDSIEHHLIAQNLVQGDGYTMYGHPTAYRAPGLTFIMAAIYSIFGVNFFLVKLTIIVISVILIWAIFYLSRLIFSDKVGLWAAFLAAIYPNFIFYSARIYTEMPFTLLSILTVIFLIKFFYTKSLFTLLLSGLFLGMAILTRPVGFVLFGFIIIILLLKLPRWENIKQILILVSTIFILILPWTIRNYIVFDKFVPISTPGAVTFWVSNNHYIAHHPYFKGNHTLYQRLPGAVNLITQDEMIRAEYSLRYAMEYFETHPGDIPRLIWNKTYRFWSISSLTGSSRRWMYEYSYLGIIIFSIFGVLMNVRPVNKNVLYLWLILLANFIPALIFWAGSRVRVPAEPALFIFSAWALNQIRVWIEQRWHQKK